MGAEHGAWPECRHKEHLAQAAFDAFRANAVPFWAGQKAAKALHATFNSYSFRQKFVAWQQWAEKRILLRDRLKLACIATRRTTLVAGVLLYKHQSMQLKDRLNAACIAIQCTTHKYLIKCSWKMG